MDLLRSGEKHSACKALYCAFFGRPKDVQDCSAVPEEVSATAFLLCFTLFSLRFPACESARMSWSCMCHVSPWGMSGSQRRQAHPGGADLTVKSCRSAGASLTPVVQVIAAAFPAMSLAWDRNVVTDSDGYYQFEGLTSLSGVRCLCVGPRCCLQGIVL